MATLNWKKLSLETIKLQISHEIVRKETNILRLVFL